MPGPAYYLRRAKACRRAMGGFAPGTPQRAAQRGKWLAYYDMARALNRSAAKEQR